MLVQASVDIRVLKEAGLFGTVSVVCNGVDDGGVQGTGVFSNGCCGTILSTSTVPVHAVCRVVGISTDFHFRLRLLFAVSFG